MTYEQEYLIHLFSASIREKFPEKPKKALDWHKVKEIASMQKILPLIYDSVDKLGKLGPDEETKKKWQDETLVCAYFFAMQNEQFYRVFNAAEEKGVELLLLKGIVLKDLYPVPELRTMGDCDIIVKKEQLDKVKELFFSCGYKIENETEKAMEFKKENALKFEVFYSVYSRLNPQKGFNGDMWKDAKPFIKEYVLKPSPEDFFVHTVAHLTKHIITRGAGIRNIADILLLIEKTEINWQIVLEKIRLLDIEKFFYGIMRMAEKYFDLKIPFDCPSIDEHFIDKLIEFMLSNGVYGAEINIFTFDARKANGKRLYRIKNYMEKLFPPVNKITKKYEYAKKHPILLPIAWVHRFFRGLFIEGITPQSGAQAMKTATKQVKGQMEILEYFNIDYKIDD